LLKAGLILLVKLNFKGIALLRSISIQLVVFFLIFQAMSFLRETSMLSTSTQLSDPTITLPTLMGKPIPVKSQGKTTVIYFFAPWCQVCHVSIGNLQALYEKNENIDVIAIALDYSSVEEVSNFTAKHQLTFPVALGNAAVKNQFSITGYPSYYVLDEDNTIKGKSLGYSSELGLYLRSL
jgi:peroxiredoxin